MKVLVVDSNVASGECLTELLKERRWECSIKHAANGKEAVGLVKRCGLQLVITDLNLEDMFGLELIKLLKGVSPQTAVVIMACTHSPVAEQKAYSAGAHAFIDKGKPFCELLLNIEEVIQTLS